MNDAVGKAPFRPLLLSTMADYPSWSSLTERTWFSRYLPPKDIPNLPPIEDFAYLYVTRASGPRLSDKSTLLFPTFAQWFTDGFMMTSASDTRRTTTSHQIDLGQLYGLTDDVQHALRTLDNGASAAGCCPRSSAVRSGRLACSTTTASASRDSTLCPRR
ncbi:hypothetical protein [Bradyrhizobium sp. Ec3.3]|uniref:hypothetical protein n=1 Tax=Bradyrhizobium sp. Ec3.3 TaxID=189753 RepID=UPI001FDA7AAB|nr:hypothetical protein [Bradyrhizobium sp. Ec3.3]